MKLTERDVERAGDRLMELYGFVPIRFSQPRNTMQTAGIPDRLYFSPSRRVAIWWEAKRPGGKQSKAQRWFQSVATASGQRYLVGTHEVLAEWLQSFRPEDEGRAIKGRERT